MARVGRIVVAINLILVSACGSASAQEAPTTAVVVPPDVVLAVVVSQPECPLKIENVRLLRYFRRDDYSTGGPGTLYQLHNTGKKAIVGYSIATWYSNNSGSIVDWNAQTRDQRLLRGMVKESADAPTIVPLTPELKSKLEFGTPMQMIRFFMILKISFADDTHYDATSTFASLREHLEAFGPVYEKRSAGNKASQPR